MSAAGSGTAVALDANGADGGPAVILAGARIAAADGIPVRLFGPAAELAAAEGVAGIEVIEAPEAIDNDEEPVRAVRSRPGASVVRAATDVAEGNSQALVSAGSTGAAMTAALFALKRLHGVQRPALAAQVPVPSDPGRTVLFLDVGANVEARAQHLIQFAYLGAAFSEAVLGRRRPRVALLSVGEETKKGTPAVVEAHDDLAAGGQIDFIGNIEGRELLEGEADVVVSDGFTGNVSLKLMEGTARAVTGAVRDAARSGPLAMAGGLLLRRALGGLRRSLDSNEAGGALLLGLRGVAVVAHGSSTPEGIANAARLAHRCVEERAVERTAELLERSGATREALRAGKQQAAAAATAATEA